MILCGANALNITQHSGAKSNTAAEYVTNIPPTEGWALYSAWRARNCFSAAAVFPTTHALPGHVIQKHCKSAYSRWDGTNTVSVKYYRNYIKVAPLPGP